MNIKKNWLIRTKDNYLLGPISKNKLEELIKNGSLRGTDEICSGNGHWILASEKDLVKKYIFENNKQDFNPVSEAKRVFQSLELDDINVDQKDLNEEEVKFPSDDDLSYPEMLGEEKKQESAPSQLIEAHVHDERRKNKGGQEDYTLAYVLKKNELATPPLPDLPNIKESEEKKDQDKKHQDEPTANEIIDKVVTEVDIADELIEMPAELPKKEKIKSSRFFSFILFLIALVLIILGFLFYRGFISSANASTELGGDLKSNPLLLQNFKKKV